MQAGLIISLYLFLPKQTDGQIYSKKHPALFQIYLTFNTHTSQRHRGWSGGAMVLGKLPVPGRPTILITVGQGPIALAVGAGGGGLDIFTLIYPFSSFSLSLGDGPI